MSKIADTEANATSLDGLVNENGLITTLRNGPKPSWQYIVDQVYAQLGYAVAGSFVDGFTYTGIRQVGVDAGGNTWIYTGGEQNLPHVVPAGTVPGAPDYFQVSVNSADNVVLDNGENLQQAIDRLNIEVDEASTASGTSNGNGGTVQDFIDSQKFNTVLDATQYEGVSFLLGSRVYISERDCWFTIELTSSGTPNGYDFIVSSEDATYSFKVDEIEPTLENLGASGANSALVNGEIYILSAVNYGVIKTSRRVPLTFGFDDTPTTLTRSSLYIDLGEQTHTFESFGGFFSDTLKILHIKASLDCNDTTFVNVASSTVLQDVNIEKYHIKNILHDSASDQCFMIEYQHSTDLSFSGRADDIRAENCRNVSSTIPMTIIGNFQDGGGYHDTEHSWDIGNCHIEEFYSVDGAGNVIDGESDAFRIFNNPTKVKIANLTTINVGKRVFKTQIGCFIELSNHSESLDSRFTRSVNHIGCLEAQTPNDGKPTLFSVTNATVDYSLAVNKPLYFNAIGAQHSMKMSVVDYTNMGVFSSSSNIIFIIESGNGSGLSLNATGSDQIVLNNFTDSNLSQINSKKSLISNFKIRVDDTGSASTYKIISASVRDGEFYDMQLGRKYATFAACENVIAKFSGGTASGDRPFAPDNANEQDPVWTNFQIDNQTGQTNATWIHRSSFTGNFVIRDFFAPDGALGFISAGVQNVTLDNCSPDTFTSGGTLTIKRATYT